MCAGYTLFNANRETYLIDEDGQVVHLWRSRRPVFSSYLCPSGHLLRDGGVGSESPFAEGGASGIIEEVTWDNERVWAYDCYPYQQTLCHHDMEPLENGNVLVIAWERKTKQQALDAGRLPELIPDGEVWSDVILELKPLGLSAVIVWQWSMWDHLIQDTGPSLPSFGRIADHPELFDVNFCPAGGKNAQRNKSLLNKDGASHQEPSGLKVMVWPCKTGDKDWLHINSVSYDPVRDQILLCIHLSSEFIIIDHGTTTEEARGHTGGKRGKGGDILYRFGNPAACRRGMLEDQSLFCAHSTFFIRGAPGEGNVLLFNNGRAPDRLYSTVEEHELPDQAGEFAEITQRKPPIWSFGQKQGRSGSFYCTHMSGTRRLPNGNTLIIMGPQGTLFEVTPEGEEVWRYVNPVRVDCDGAVACVRQGDFRTTGRFSLFNANKYPGAYPGFFKDGEPRCLRARGYLEVL